MMVRALKPERLQRVKDEISEVEKEAVELERIEAEMLIKLKQTQRREIQAFERFESAMIEASHPRSQRVQSIELSTRNSRFN
jgi:hypothetical protein